MGRIVLVTGGARSGKSRFALNMVVESAFPVKRFIATAEVTDGEMAQRIRRHREDRPPGVETVEAPYDLAGAIDRLPGSSASVVDCLTVWLGNAFHASHDTESLVMEKIAELTAAVGRFRSRSDSLLTLVTNEVGMGIVPADAVSRLFRDCAGILNQRIAASADEVFLCVAGIAVKVK